MYRKIMGACIRLVDAFYRHERFGEEVPTDGPVLLVGNHTNGLVDGVMLSRQSQREVRFIGKSTLMGTPVLGWLLRGISVIPVFRRQDGGSEEDNLAAFDEIHRALSEAQVIGLFPEGSSHSEPALQRFKTGVARMALGAEEAAGWTLGVRIVPVGFHYEARDTYRSKVTAWIGEPVTIDDLRTAYGEDGRQTVQVLTDRVVTAVEQVTLNLDRREDRPLLDLFEAVEAVPEGKKPQRMKALAGAFEGMRRDDPEAADALATRFRSFGYTLSALGLDPVDLDRRAGLRGALKQGMRALSSACLVLPLCVLGALIWAPPVLLARLIHRCLPLRPDKYSSVVLLAGAILLPVWASFLITFSALQFGDVTCILTAGLLVITAIGCHRTWPLRRGVLRNLAALLNLAPDRKLWNRLNAERDLLASELAHLGHRG